MFTINKARRLLRVFLILILVTLINFDLFVYPALAISTIDACMRQPSCAGAFVTKSGVKAAVKTGAPAVNNIVRFSRSGATVKTVQKAYSGKTMLGIFGTTLLAKYFGEQAIEELRNKVLETYCQANGNCIEATYNVFPINEQGNPITRTTGVSYRHIGTQNLTFENVIDTNGYSVRIFDSSSEVVRFPTFEDTFELRYVQVNPGTEFDDLSEQQVDDIFDSFPLQDIIDFTTDEELDNDLRVGDIIDIDGQQIIDADGNLVDQIEVTQEDIDEELTEEELKEQEKEQQQSTELDESIYEPEEFDTPIDWFTYSKLKFSNKFPFDIFGDINGSSGVPDCPSYTFFDRVYELCPIRDMLVLFKYPAIIGYLIWTFQTL